MKNLKQITGIILIIILFFSCKKDKPIVPTEVTLTGKIVLNCTQAPMVNRDLEIWVEYGVWEKNNIFEIKTDSNGNFNLSFTPRKEKYNVSIRPAGMADILTIDSDDLENLGTIIATPTCNVVMKIKVNNPYSLGDTMFFSDYINYSIKGIRIPAPFRDTILPVAYNYFGLKWPSNFEHKNTTFIQSNIYIRGLWELPLMKAYLINGLKTDSNLALEK